MGRKVTHPTGHKLISGGTRTSKLESKEIYFCHSAPVWSFLQVPRCGAAPGVHNLQQRPLTAELPCHGELRCFPWPGELQEINDSAARAGHGVQRTGHLPSGLLPRIGSGFSELGGICRRQMWINSQFGFISAPHERTERCLSKSPSAGPKVSLTRAGEQNSALSLHGWCSNLVFYSLFQSWTERLSGKLISGVTPSKPCVKVSKNYVLL